MLIGKHFYPLLAGAAIFIAAPAIANPILVTCINELETSPDPRVELHFWPSVYAPGSLDGWTLTTSFGTVRIDSGYVLDSLSFLAFDSTNLSGPLRMNPAADTLTVSDAQGLARDRIIWPPPPTLHGPPFPPPDGWSAGILNTFWYMSPMYSRLIHWYYDPTPSFGSDNRTHLGYITGVVRDTGGNRIGALLHAFSDSGTSFSYCVIEPYNPYLMAVPRGTYRVWALASGYDSTAYVGPVVVATRDTVRNINIVLAPSGVEEDTSRIFPQGNGPSSVAISPNPARGQRQVVFSLSAPAKVALAVYDLQGKKVRVLVDEQRGPGKQTVIWDGRNEAGRAVRSGSYFLRLDAGDRTMVRKITLLK